MTMHYPSVVSVALKEQTYICTLQQTYTAILVLRTGGICGGQSGAGAGFLRVLRFPLPIFIPPIAPQSSSSIIWGLCNRPEVAAVPGT
jgi:hypothetical protein